MRYSCKVAQFLIHASFESIFHSVCLERALDLVDLLRVELIVWPSRLVGSCHVPEELYTEYVIYIKPSTFPSKSLRLIFPHYAFKEQNDETSGEN